jgi:hypothetical protein
VDLYLYRTCTYHCLILLRIRIGRRVPKGQEGDRVKGVEISRVVSVFLSTSTSLPQSYQTPAPRIPLSLSRHYALRNLAHIALGVLPTRNLLAFIPAAGQLVAYLAEVLYEFWTWVRLYAISPNTVQPTVIVLLMSQIQQSTNSFMTKARSATSSNNSSQPPSFQSITSELDSYIKSSCPSNKSYLKIEKSYLRSLPAKLRQKTDVAGDVRSHLGISQVWLW